VKMPAFWRKKFRRYVPSGGGFQQVVAEPRCRSGLEPATRDRGPGFPLASDVLKRVPRVTPSVWPGVAGWFHPLLGAPAGHDHPPAGLPPVRASGIFYGLAHAIRFHGRGMHTHERAHLVLWKVRRSFCAGWKTMAVLAR